MWYRATDKAIFTAHSEIRSAFPMVSLPGVLSDAVLSGLGLVPLVDGPIPTPTHLVNRAEPGDITVSEGVATRAWRLVPLTQAEIDAQMLQDREAAKAERQRMVDNIKVTTAAGNTFDGDEVSQGRMSRAIIALSTGAATTVNWVLADNTVIQATVAELTEALVLAGAEQARIWVLQ